ncbi:MAG: MaoC family dehydratase N-terminal domain-containing protein [Rhizorhabdus sp.]
MSQRLLSEEALSQIGTVSRQRRGLVTAYDIAKFCSGIGEEGAEHFDDAAAQAMGYPGIVAPPTFPALTTRPVPPRSGYLADGQYDDVAPPGLGHLQTMLGGQDWTVHRLARVGDVIEERRTVLSMDEREGKTGPMGIVRSEQAFATADGEPIETLISTLILRVPPPKISGREALARDVESAATILPEAGPNQLVVQPDMIQSFLFNAAIWAVHRIHWDIPYAQSEGLPSTLIVGWNLANFVARLGKKVAPEGKRLNRIDLSYRAIAHPGDMLTCEAGDFDTYGLRAVHMKNQHGVTNVVGRLGWI